MSRKAAYKFFTMSGAAQSKDLVNAGYADAYQKGYSVVEIARIIGMKSAKYIHLALVKQGYILRGKSGRQAKGSVPKGMGLFLSARSLSFIQWCAGWHIDPHEALDQIKSSSGAAMTALRRDFPGYYKQLTGVVIEDFAKGAIFEAYRPEINLSWDEKEGCYKASAPGVTAYGLNYQTALSALLHQQRNNITVKRLADLPNLGQPEMTW